MIITQVAYVPYEDQPSIVNNGFEFLKWHHTQGLDSRRKDIS